MVGVTMVTGEQLGQPVEVEQRGRFELRAADPLYMIVEAVSDKAHSEAAMFNWPYRTAVIAVGVVCGIVRRTTFGRPSR